MRYISVELPEFYKNAVARVAAKYPYVQNVDGDFLQDVMFVVAQGYDLMWKNLVTVQELVQEVSRAYVEGKIANMRLYEAELFSMRMDLIDFADSGFAKQLRIDPFLRLEEKFELVIVILEEMLKSRSTPQNLKKEMQDMGQIQAAGGGGATQAPTTMQGSNAGASGASGASSGGRQVISHNFFKGFSFMASHLFDMADSKDQEEKENGGKGASRDVSAISEMYRESLGNKIKISDMVDKIWGNQYMQMFEIAHNLELTFSTEKKGKLVESDCVASNLTVSRMHRMKDVGRAVRMDLALEDVIDRKIMTRQLRVQKFRERKDQKQFLYALLDHSGSTSDFYPNINLSRLSFIKAIAISLGKKALKDGSKFYFRWFEGGVGDVYKLERKSQWNNFLSHVLNQKHSGGTNIDLAMHVAAEDMAKEVDGMDRADMIVITDGTQDIAETEEFFALRKRGAKYHFILLEDLNEANSNFERLAESFQVVDLDKIASLDGYKPDFRTVV